MNTGGTSKIVKIIPLIDNFESIAVVLLRSGETASELFSRIRKAEEKVASER